MIEAVSIDGTWLAGLLIALGVVLFTILAVRIGGRVSFAHPGSTPTRAGGKRDVRSGGGTPDRRQPTTARRLLDERYARGDLMTEEYRERIRVLGEGT